MERITVFFFNLNLKIVATLISILNNTRFKLFSLGEEGSPVWLASLKSLQILPHKIHQKHWKIHQNTREKSPKLEYWETALANG